MAVVDAFMKTVIGLTRGHRRIERSHPGSVMSGDNKVNGVHQATGNALFLETVVPTPDKGLPRNAGGR